MCLKESFARKKRLAVFGQIEVPKTPRYHSAVMLEGFEGRLVSQTAVCLLASVDAKHSSLDTTRARTFGRGTVRRKKKL